jgi:hypothetical protein
MHINTKRLCMTNLYSTSHKRRKAEIMSSKARNDISVSTLSNLSQYSIGIPSKKTKVIKHKSYSNKKERTQIVPICRWYHTMIKRYKVFSNKFTTTDKHFDKVARCKIKNKLDFYIPIINMLWKKWAKQPNS